MADCYDPTLMRNCLAFDLAEKMGIQSTPGHQRVEVYVDGEYKGLYLLTEKIEEGKNRVDIDVDNGDFLLEMDHPARTEEGNVYFTSENGFYFRVREPENVEYRDLVKEKWNRFEKIIYSGDWKNVSQAIDVNSFADYYIINEYLKTIDFGEISVYFYSQNGTICAGPVWDFDLSSGNGNVYFYGQEKVSPQKENAVYCHYFKWLLKYKEFRQIVYNNYIECLDYMSNVYSENGWIDNQLLTFNDAFERNYADGIWNVSRQYASLERKPDVTYGENVQYLRNWLAERDEWMQGYINYFQVGLPYSYYNGDFSYDVAIPHIIINQIYGGKKSASYASNDFIELYNPTDEDVDLSGWSLQYRSSIDGGDNTSWSKLDLTGTIKSHCSYLVKCKAATGTEDWHINIDDCDQEWKQKINNKGCTVVLVANNRLIDSDSPVYDNETGKPVISGYVDMVGVSGNDVSSEDDINNEAALYFEKEASKVQSRKSAIRRTAFADTDDNTVEGDFEVVDYSFENADYIAYIFPKCTSDGPWTYDEDAVPKYTVSIDKNIKGEDVTELKYTYNTLFDVPEEPVREGYTFTGWFTDKGLTKEYDFTKKPVSDVTLYAGWKVNNYTIRFESNGGEEIQSITKGYGGRVTELLEPKFLGGGVLLCRMVQR